MASGLSATATMTPRGAACIRRARIDTTLTAVVRSKTPAMVAATYSPMLCPAMIDGRDPVGLDQLGQRVLHREQRGLGPVGVLEVASDAVEDLGAQVVAHLVAECGRALVEVPGEHRLAVVEAAGHPDVLCALPGEQERDSVA